MNAIILSQVVIDLDNRLVLEWDSAGKLWLYMAGAESHTFEGDKANELWRFYTKEPDPEKQPEKFTKRGAWKE